MLIGGDKQGKGTLAHADTTTIDAATTIKANATTTGNGGTVVVWSDSKTEFAGFVSATGGTLGGNGGNAEVSSHGVLAYTGLTVLTAPLGRTGTLPDTGGFTASSDDSVINVTTLQTALQTANVTVSTGSGGSQTGDITVAAPLTWSANTLTLDAYHSISINAPVTVAGTGGLTLTTNVGGTGGDFSFGLTGYGFTGRVDFTGTPGQQALTINGSAYTLLYSMADVASVNSALSGAYALAGNLDASGTTYTNGLIANDGIHFFTGTFEGLGHTISGLTITSSNDVVGLIGTLDSTGMIRNLGSVGGSVSGNIYVGALVGKNDGTITASYASGAVLGGSNLGGLVGENVSGTVSGSYATGVVSGGDFVGGPVGENLSGTITASYATGAVSGPYSIGGLVGDESGSTISNVYATGAVSGGSSLGGLVGRYLNDTVSNTYWDTQTTGLSTSGEGTGLTTRQLQGLDPLTPGGSTYFSVVNNLGDGTTSAFAGGANGLYPYLTTFFPTGAQAISGIAYADTGVTPAASSIHGPRYVYVDIAGKQTAVTTGANGYYYLMVAGGTLSSANGGTPTLAYTLAGNVVGPVSGATLIAATGTTQHLYIWGNALIAPTTATSLSTAPTNASDLISPNQTLLANAAGSDAAATSNPLGSLGSVGYIATGANGFNVDQGISPYGLYVQTTNGPITVSAQQDLGDQINVSLYSAGALTVSAPITMTSTISSILNLSATNSLAINAPIQVNGNGAVNLAAGLDTTTVPGVSLQQLSFGNGAGLTFPNSDGTTATASQGGTLAINGQAYSLLYSMTDFEQQNTGGLNAIATNLDASATPYGGAVVSSFSGTLEGLSHTVSNLTITGTNSSVGLIGLLQASGVIRDLGLVGGSVSGDQFVGGLVGQSNGSISNTYAAVTRMISLCRPFTVG